MSEKWLEKFDGSTIDGLIDLQSEYRIDSLVCALESRLGQKGERSTSEDLVLSICAFDREINNGGFLQYLDNSSSGYAHRIVGDLAAIGLQEASDRVSKLLALIGVPGQPSYDAIQDVVRAGDRDDECPFEEEFEEFDDYFYDDVGDCSHFLWFWILSNRSQIRLS